MSNMFLTTDYLFTKEHNKKIFVTFNNIINNAVFLRIYSFYVVVFLYYL